MSDTDLAVFFEDSLAKVVETGAELFLPDAAIRRPIAEVVASTLVAAGQGNENTARVYRMAIGLFLQFLESERGHMIPGDVAPAWLPFAESRREKQPGKGHPRTVWTFRPPAVVLRWVDADLLDAFAVWRTSEGDAVNTVNLRVAAVRTFLSVALRANVLTLEQAVMLRISPYQSRRKRDEKPVGRRLTKAEVRALRGSVDVGTVRGVRDLAMLDCMLFLGLRSAEVANLDMDAFEQDGGRWWLVFPGKGGKTRKLKVHDVLYKSMAAWFRVAELDWRDSGKPVFLSVNKGGDVSKRRVNVAVVGRVVAEYGERSRIAPRSGKGRLGAHDLRRTCAKNAHDNGAPLLRVQMMLGHKSPKTTARYIGLGQDDDATAVDYVRYSD